MISADWSGDAGKEEVKEEDDHPGRLREKLLWLYLFAFWSQFKPSEPFLVDYLIEEKGIGSEQVYQDVLDLFVYSRLPFLIIVGFFAEFDCCGYRAVLVVGALCGVVTVLMTRFGMGICSQQAAQFTVSAAFASRVAISGSHSYFESGDALCQLLCSCPGRTLAGRPLVSIELPLRPFCFGAGLIAAVCRLSALAEGITNCNTHRYFQYLRRAFAFSQSTKMFSRNNDRHFSGTVARFVALTMVTTCYVVDSLGFGHESNPRLDTDVLAEYGSFQAHFERSQWLLICLHVFCCIPLNPWSWERLGLATKYLHTGGRISILSCISLATAFGC